MVEQLAGLDDYTMAIAAYWAAVEARPRDSERGEIWFASSNAASLKTD